MAGLFAGVGGIELGLDRAGHHTELLCEAWQPAVRVLENRFPGVPLHLDVQTLRSLPRSIDLAHRRVPLDVNRLSASDATTAPVRSPTMAWWTMVNETSLSTASTASECRTRSPADVAGRGCRPRLERAVRIAVSRRR